ncbi:helix-turn-helix domain-containing protein [Chitinophaga sp. 30R24]|uniref:helix-turn-helix domain-containing protein n=1 Tax=Chitinophaga sp. 30R24 TaxID=3248838 RepID=UPI003B917204
MSHTKPTTFTEDLQQQYNILYSCVSKQKRGHQQIVAEHALCYVQAGEIRFYTNEGTISLMPGDFGIIRRNQLAKSLKLCAPDGTPFRSTSIFLEQSLLHRYSKEHNIVASGPYTGKGLVVLSPDPFLKGYFESLQPYYEQPVQLTSAMAELKTREALELLLRFRQEMKSFLFDFSEPHKIDLEAFMNQNFTYHVPISQFARLTGRSLATFKRDFQKVFPLPPEKWLIKKRLEEAHFLIAEKRQAPSQVYLEVGFENLSHFSDAFKRMFGYNPSNLAAIQAEQ